MLCSFVCFAVALIRLAALSSLSLWELSSVGMEEAHCENKHQSIRRRRDTEGSCGVFHRLLRLFWVSRFVVLKAGTATRKQGLGERCPSFNQGRKAETTHIGHQREVLSISLSKSDTLLALLDSHESLDSSPRCMVSCSFFDPRRTTDG